MPDDRSPRRDEDPLLLGDVFRAELARARGEAWSAGFEMGKSIGLAQGSKDVSSAYVSGWMNGRQFAIERADPADVALYAELCAEPLTKH